jgi:8-oxo-dGTP pyrophosphatase MutT (NUDIX family)
VSSTWEGAIITPAINSAAPEAVPASARVRPRDAATLIVLRRDSDTVRLLMGQRSASHVFHPDKVVFPGGRVDPPDRHAPAADELHPAVAAKLSASGRTAAWSRSFAVAAVRETFEEVGIMIGAPCHLEVGRRVHPCWAAFVALGLLPSLSPLRLVARAITPPGGNRRYDARFFAVFANAIAAQVQVAQNELISSAWLTFEEARAHPLPRITRTILDHLEQRLAHDPDLDPGTEVPFHFVRHGKRQVGWL